MSNATREGGCACGAARYRLSGEPLFVNNCHCSQCQRQTGSTSVVNMFYDAQDISLLAGQTTRHVVKAGSGGDHVIVRCAACGTALWSQYPRLGELAAGVRAGTLDDPSNITPDAVIFTAERMPWVVLPDGIPAFEGFYRPADVLAPDRVARLRALAERAANR